MSIIGLENLFTFRLPTDETTLSSLLKSFYSKKKGKTPRKEYLRCNIFRKFIKLVNCIIKGKAKLCLDPIFLNFCSLVLNNKEELLQVIERDNLPYTENRKNLQFKSFNDEFCEKFFKDRPFVQQIFCVFIEYIFSLSIENLSKNIGVYCCEEHCENANNCLFRYQQLKLYIVQDIICKNS